MKRISPPGNLVKWTIVPDLNGSDLIGVTAGCKFLIEGTIGGDFLIKGASEGGSRSEEL